MYPSRRPVSDRGMSEVYRLAILVGSRHNDAAGAVELRIMPPLCPVDDVTAYIVVEDFGHLGRAFRETDLTEADLNTIVRNMISGEYSDPLRVVAFNTVEGWSRDVSEDIANEVLDRVNDGDDTLTRGPSASSIGT
jgi:hypothetical protein